MRELKFYYMAHCPFCKKVMQYMDRNGIEIEMLDIKADPQNQKDLIEIGGIDQVPMLLIDGNPLYESDDIIQWFKENM
ncbi:MAG: glutathione S-transferase N-terminal domain-containing protein [Tissierellaceae bacterium]|nr:glutathione S-transferase N-terminal domain-containing protein [Tissierellaceae bacterium]